VRDNAYVGGEYFERNPTWHVEDSPWKARRILQLLKRNNVQPKSICEIGCGAGEILNQLYLGMPEDTVFSGYEISPQAFDLCRERTKGRLNFYLGDGFEDKTAYFDVVLCIDVLEHLEDYFSFLRNFKRKGRYKVFHIPLDLSVQTVFRSSPILWWRHNVRHIHYFTKEIAVEILKDMSYEIIDFSYTAVAIDMPAKSSGSLLARSLRKMMFGLNEDLTVRILGGYSLLILAE